MKNFKDSQGEKDSNYKVISTWLSADFPAETMGQEIM